MKPTFLPNSYPIFAPNQVLNAEDLNQIVGYLDTHNRLSRRYLIGTGIISGMEIIVNSTTSEIAIEVSEGYGITSEGYFVYVPATSLKFYENQQDVKADIFFADSDGLENPSKIYQVTELFEQVHELENPQKIQQNILQDRVLAIAYDLQEQSKNTLLNSDEQGAQQNFRLRFLLLPRIYKGTTDENIPSAEDLLKPPKAPNQLLDYNLKIKRFGYEEKNGKKSVCLTNITNYDLFKQNYEIVCRQAIAQIDPALGELLETVAPIISTFGYNLECDYITNLKSNLEQKLTDIISRNSVRVEEIESQYCLQYFYDYLWQLIAAIQELAIATSNFINNKQKNLQSHPNYLLLGLVTIDKKYKLSPNLSYRHHFIQPGIYNSIQDSVKQLHQLYLRVVNLSCKDSLDFVIDSHKSIVISPCKAPSALIDDRSIPDHLSPEINNYWNYTIYNQNHSSKLSEDAAIYRLDSYNFFRLEGHLGKNSSDILKIIQEYQERYNLSFDTILLKLGETPDLQYVDNNSIFIEDLANQFNLIKRKLNLLCNNNKNIIRYGNLVNALKQYLLPKANLTNIDLDQLLELLQNLDSINLIPSKFNIELQSLLEAYRQRKYKLAESHLFHKFAQNHLGLEHLGGVTPGGTLILVYVAAKELEKEASDQEKITVADFFLPHKSFSNRLINNTFAIAPRPTIWLEKTSFCANDEREYELMLYPPGGTIIQKGNIFNSTGKCHFQPSSVGNIESKEKITFAYVVNGKYDIFTVTVSPISQAKLNLESDIYGEELRVISLAKDTADNIELLELKIDGEITQENILNPQQYRQEKIRQIEVEATILDRLTGSENRIKQTVNIHPLPQAKLNLESDIYGKKPRVISLTEDTPKNIELLELKIGGKTVETKTLEPIKYKGYRLQKIEIEAIIRDNVTKSQNTIYQTITIHPFSLTHFYNKMSKNQKILFAIGIFSLMVLALFLREEIKPSNKDSSFSIPTENIIQ